MTRLAELAVEIFRPRQEQVAKERASAAEQARRADEQTAHAVEDGYRAQLAKLGQRIEAYERRHPAPAADPETRALNDAAASRAALIAKAAEGLRKKEEEKLRVKAAKRLRKAGL